MSAYRYTMQALRDIPNCMDISRKYCVRYSGILVADGKYLNVQPYEYKIPTVYGIDYLTHDIPAYRLSTAENHQTLLMYFTSLRLLNYPLKALVCDDNINIRETCLEIYPNTIVQLCQNHFKQNVRNTLDLRNNPQYIPFFRDILVLFSKRRSHEEFSVLARRLTLKYMQFELCVRVMLDIQDKLPLLLAHLKQPSIPRTNNIIEGFNSHIQARLVGIRSFESFNHANLWLNGYFLKRRVTKFTDCKGKFKHLNGKTSLSIVQKPDVDIPRIF